MTLWSDDASGQDSENVTFEQNAYIKKICPALINEFYCFTSVGAKIEVLGKLCGAF